MSPYQLQMFYKVTNKNYIIQLDDIIASRCTINSNNISILWNVLCFNVL